MFMIIVIMMSMIMMMVIIIITYYYYYHNQDSFSYCILLIGPSSELTCWCIDSPYHSRMVGNRVISYYRLASFCSPRCQKKTLTKGRVLSIHSTYGYIWVVAGLVPLFLSYRWTPVGHFFCAREKMVSWRYTTRKVDGATPPKVAICFRGHDKPRPMEVAIAIYSHYGVDPRSYYLSLVAFLYVFHIFFHDNKNVICRSPYWVVVP